MDQPSKGDSNELPPLVAVVPFTLFIGGMKLEGTATYAGGKVEAHLDIDRLRRHIC